MNTRAADRPEKKEKITQFTANATIKWNNNDEAHENVFNKRIHN